jgi:uncharacterized protein (TIGR02611 family)
MRAPARRIAIGILGWVVVLVGLAAIPLPGPGWMMVYAGLKLLATEFEWARRWLDPVELRALKGAAEAVATVPRIVMSSTVIAGTGAFGVLWILGPDAPGWWPIDDRWWLPGGLWTGVTLLVSCVLAIALLIYSFRRFYGKPEEIDALSKELDEADEEIKEHFHHKGHRDG